MYTALKKSVSLHFSFFGGHLPFLNAIESGLGIGSKTHLLLKEVGTEFNKSTKIKSRFRNLPVPHTHTHKYKQATDF
jgi:hypothetical protein